MPPGARPHTGHSTEKFFFNLSLFKTVVYSGHVKKTIDRKKSDKLQVKKKKKAKSVGV